MHADRRRRFVAYFDGPPLKGDVQKLIQRTGYTKGRVSQIFNPEHPFGERAAVSLALKLGLPRTAFLDDNGDGWMAPQRADEGRPAPGVAQTMSHPVRFDALPTITWESLVESVPDSLFVLVLRDDAVGPDYPKGTGIVWSKKREPRPGRLLLLRDGYEQHHVRVYSAGRAPGEWSGVALTRGYPALGPEDAEIVAVSRGVLEADDDVPEVRGGNS